MLLELLILGGAMYAARKYSQSPAETSSSTEITEKAANPIFEKTRNQQLQEYSSTEEDGKITEEEKTINTDLVISTTSLSLAILGNLFSPSLRLLSLPGWFYVYIPAFKKASKSLREEKKADVNALSLITAIGCFFGNFYAIGNLAAFFYVVSKKLTLQIQNNSQQSIINVFGQHPKFVWVLINGLEVKTPFEALKQGDIVVVSAGEAIPADGLIIEGLASVDQHILTGEAQPVEKEIGTRVFAATIVLTGRVCIEVEKAGEETTAAQIGQILNQTTHFKTNGQLRADALTEKSVLPTLIAGGLSIPILGPMGAVTVNNAHFSYRMLVVSSIVTLTYLQVVTQKGILIKSGEVLDLLSQVDTIVFDKTGTLTLPKPYIGKIHTLKGYTENEVLAYAAAAEYKQTHPIALAILEEAEARGLSIPETDEIEYEIGYGLKVTIHEQVIQLGSHRLMEKENITLPPSLQATEASAHALGHSLIMLALNGQLIGAIELFPTVRPEAKAVLQALRQDHGIESMYIISGDNEMPTKKLAQELGIEHYFANVLPQRKAEIIEQLQDAGKTVCYIGDGINDSIALKKAQVSISLRGASTIATDTAQIILMNESLEQLCDLFEFAQEFETTMSKSFNAILTPTFICMVGAFFLDFSVIHTVVLKEIGLTASLANATHPLFKHRPEDEDAKKPMALLPKSMNTK
jgi:heavy metal translocating P-type ATPase